MGEKWIFQMLSLNEAKFFAFGRDLSETQ